MAITSKGATSKVAPLMSINQLAADVRLSACGPEKPEVARLLLWLPGSE